MRYRRSRETRQQITAAPQNGRRVYRLLFIVLILVTALGWGGWWVYRSGGIVHTFYWLINRPVPVEPEIDIRSFAYKSDQEKYRAIDFAIAQGLVNLQAAPSNVSDEQPRRLSPDGVWLPTKRTVRVASAYTLTQCNLELTRSVVAAGGRVIRAEENSRTHELILHVAYGMHRTHELVIIRDPGIPRRTGRVALVIDDLGDSDSDIAQQFLQIGKPLTFALVPWQPESVRLAAEAVRRQQEVLVHLPMEPKNYPRVSPGKRAILVSQTLQQNRQIVQDALSALSVAGGVNHHMGSRVTESRETMRIVLSELKMQNKFYIDSRTSMNSVAYTVAKEIGVRAAASWGYIDEFDNQERIAQQLDQASHYALEQGSALVIAQARYNTLTVLQQKMERLELRGIEFVHASSLVN